MQILTFNPGHDGTIALLDEDKLRFSYEAEKDSFPRFARVNTHLILKVFSSLQNVPEVIAVAGTKKQFAGFLFDLDAGYYGFSESAILDKTEIFLGQKRRFFSTTHERAHIFCTYGMSPFPQGQPVYILAWEGNIGSFYLIDEHTKVFHLGEVMKQPGNKYAILYGLADPNFYPFKGNHRLDDAGKLMALASFSDHASPTTEEQIVIDYILEQESVIRDRSLKAELQNSKYYNIGVEHEDFKQLAGKHSDAIFDKFYQFAKLHLTEGYPLLITGGCGLNCEWNSKWKDCGLFPDVFVPPVPNDSGIAIGTAVDALRHFTGQAKIQWDPYSGQDFIHTELNEKDVYVTPLDYTELANFIKNRNVVAWVQGRCEIGPRALGNRSILASPLESGIKDKLNAIKQRENFRPIAPVCLEESVSDYFHWEGPSPYMLYFQRLKTDKLPAITHIDNTARTQTINKTQNPRLHNLLLAFKQLTNFGVLCNTSLNFKGAGFINKTRDLYLFCKKFGIDGFVIEDKFYRFK